MFIHVLENEVTVVALPAVERRIMAARTLEGAKVEFVQTALGVIISLSAGDRDPYDNVVVLELE